MVDWMFGFQDWVLDSVDDFPSALPLARFFAFSRLASSSWNSPPTSARLKKNERDGENCIKVSYPWEG